MVSTSEAVKKVSGFLANRISLEQLEDWSALYLQNTYRSGDDEARRLARLVRSLLNAFEDDETESALREELANTIRPFEIPQRSNVVEYVRFGVRGIEVTRASSRAIQESWGAVGISQGWSSSASTSVPIPKLSFPG